MVYKSQIWPRCLYDISDLRRKYEITMWTDCNSASGFIAQPMFILSLFKSAIVMDHQVEKVRIQDVKAA